MSHPSPSSTSFTKLGGELQRLLNAALAPGSRAAYQRSWRAFSFFCSEHHLAFNLPIQPCTLALFISHLTGQGYAPTTVSAHVSAIAYVHKLNNWQDPSASFLVQKLLGASYKLNRQPDCRRPIDKPMLIQLITALDHTVENSQSIILFKAMFSLAFHALLRIGEMTVQSHSQHNPNLLRIEHVHLGQASLTVTFLAYKHNTGRPFSLLIHATPGQPTCPLAHVRTYTAIRGLVPGPLFVDSRGQPVTRAHFNEQLKHALRFRNYPLDQFSSHSFRIGAATTAAAQGTPDNQIQQMGRWRSDAFKKYIRCSQRLSAL